MPNTEPDILVTAGDSSTSAGDGTHWFWAPSFWLPPGVTWKDLQSNDQIQYPKFEDLLYPIPLAVLLICLRLILDRLVFHPVGKYYGMRTRKKNFLVPNDILERAYASGLRSKAKMNSKDIVGLAKRAEMETRQVERWFRRRAFMDKPTTLAKFSECGWRFFCYMSSIIIGLAVLWDKPWFWDRQYCWINYPRHEISAGVWWYYMLSSAFYWSLMFSQFFDAHRKDFWQMFIHHVTTIFLLGFSWTCNLTRVGTLVLLVHDTADPFLEIAKMAKYANFSRLCWFLFGVFSIMFLATRLWVYPMYVLKSTLFEKNHIVPTFPAHYFFNGMLLLLLVLHMFWTCLLFKAIFRAAFIKKLEDVRSSSETCSDDSSEKENQNLGDGEKNNLIKNQLNNQSEGSNAKDSNKAGEKGASNLVARKPF